MTGSGHLRSNDPPRRTGALRSPPDIHASTATTRDANRMLVAQFNPTARRKHIRHAHFAALARIFNVQACFNGRSTGSTVASGPSADRATVASQAHGCGTRAAIVIRGRHGSASQHRRLGARCCGIVALTGGRHQRVTVDMRHAAIEFRSERYFRIDGKEPADPWDKIAGTYRCVTAGGFVCTPTSRITATGCLRCSPATTTRLRYNRRCLTGARRSLKRLQPKRDS